MHEENRNIEPDEDLIIKGKAKLDATNKMLDCFASSPHRRMILLFLSRREKSIFDIIENVKEMSSSSANVSVKRTLEDLRTDGLIKEEGKVFKLTEKGGKLAKIFDISLEVYGDNTGAK